jgi:hypothetical protein
MASDSISSNQSGETISECSDLQAYIGGGRLNPFCREGYEHKYGGFEGSLNKTNSLIP